MKISYYPDVDYVHIRLRSEAKGTVAGEDIAPGIVLLTDDEGVAIEIEIDAASKRLDLGQLEIEGLPVSVTREERQESKAGQG